MMPPRLPSILRDLVLAFRTPERFTDLNPGQWDALIPIARRADVLLKIASTVSESGILPRLPERVQMHLKGALTLNARQRIHAAFEIDEIEEALRSVGVRPTLLKGAAYFAAGHAFSKGRAFGDIDILVGKDQLARVESALMRRGWISAVDNSYDQRYYREWMHELPPMMHIKRGTVLDVHHRILPETARSRPDPGSMMRNAVECPGHPGVYVLSRADMLLHSAAHLFHEGELEHGFRDLLDLDALLSLVRTEEDWHALTARARSLELDTPLYLACHFCAALLDTPIPADVLDRLQPLGPQGLPGALLRRAYSLALLPTHSSLTQPLTGLARWSIYVRAHWLRMPPLLLVRHLARKWARNWMGLHNADKTADPR